MRIYLLNLSEAADFTVERYLPLISEARRREIFRFQREKDRRAKILAEILARELAAAEMGCSVEEIQLERDERGKPWLVNSPLQISLSHSSNWVACSISAARNGVDVEENFSDALEIAKSFFAPTEYLLLQRLYGDELRRKFLSLWTLKESYAKFLGTGIDEKILRLDIKELQSRANVFCQNFYLEDGAAVGFSAEGSEPGCEIKFIKIGGARQENDWLYKLERRRR